MEISSDSSQRERRGTFSSRLSQSDRRGSTASSRKAPDSPAQQRKEQSGSYFPDSAAHQDEKPFYDGEKDPEKEGLELSESSDEEAQARADATVTELAKTLTRQSTWDSVADSPFYGKEDSDLDPNSRNFRPRQWVKSMIKLNEAEAKTPSRTGGFAFRNLSVHGFGEATDYQKDVGNIWLEAIGMVKKAFGLVKPRRIDILRDFEGIVRSGEMLVVLGPPGSGCSTFLKTITGETHGFVVDQGSYMNYQGIPPEQMHKYFRGEAIYTAEVDVHFPMLRSVFDRIHTS